MKVRHVARDLEAECFDPEALEALSAGFLAAICRCGLGTHISERQGFPPYWHIHTLQGPMLVLEGDWIVRGLKGEYYTVRDDVFRTSYAPAAAEALDGEHQ